MDATIQAEASISQQLTAVLQGSAYAALDQTGWIRVTGSDRVRWLNGMLTNSIQALTPGQGCYNFALNSQGRIQADATAFAPSYEPEALLLETERSQIPALIAHLDKFIIMDDVELADESDSWRGLLVAGPHAQSTLERLGFAPADEHLSIRTASWKGNHVVFIHAYSPLVPRFEVWTDPATAALLADELAHSLLRLSAEALEHLRVLEGTPRYGIDIRDSERAHDLPQETAPVGTESRALHFAKGCYLGQEIVERVRSRGNVHRTFSGFELAGELPPAGTILEAGGKSIGELTTVAAVPLAGGMRQIALGYVRRDALDRNLQLQYAGGIATPVRVPMNQAASRS